MEEFITQLLIILVALLGGAYFLKGNVKNPFKKKDPPIFPSGVRPLADPPDISKIKEEFKNETTEESVDHVNDLFDELFPGD